mgnify:CR=1 FL=1
MKITVVIASLALFFASFLLFAYAFAPASAGAASSASARASSNSSMITTDHRAR